MLKYQAMLKIQQVIAHLVEDRRGQDYIEHALLAALVVIVAGMILPVAAESAGIIYSKAASIIVAFGGRFGSTAM